MPETYPKCPVCGTPHKAGEYKDQGGYWRPDDVACPCGAILRHTVPLFMPNSYGYIWKGVINGQA